MYETNQSRRQSRSFVFVRERVVFITCACWQRDWRDPLSFILSFLRDRTCLWISSISSAAIYHTDRHTGTGSLTPALTSSRGVRLCWYKLRPVLCVREPWPCINAKSHVVCIFNFHKQEDVWLELPDGPVVCVCVVMGIPMGHIQDNCTAVSQHLRTAQLQSAGGEHAPMSGQEGTKAKWV